MREESMVRRHVGREHTKAMGILTKLKLISCLKMILKKSSFVNGGSESRGHKAQGGGL
jgi:hypothetical protein